MLPTPSAIAARFAGGSQPHAERAGQTNEEAAELDLQLRDRKPPRGSDRVHGYGDLYVPFGVYEVTKEEIEPLREHAAMIFKLSEAARETACSRLSDAHTRLRPQDRIVDAAIGLEALLLAGRAGDGRRQLLHRAAALQEGQAAGQTRGIGGTL
jgi:hypothetical protein